MDKFLFKLIYLVPVIFVVVLTNYNVDPANLFSNKRSNQDSLSYELQILNNILEGYNVTNLDTYDERVFNKKFIQSIVVAPETVILGSSRSQLINKDIFDCDQLINNSVTGATLEDIIALFNIYENNHLKPHKILLEISPWMLNDNNEQDRWSVLEDEYNSFLEKLDKNEIDEKKILINPKYKELISFEYFQESINYLRHKKEIKNPFLFNELSFDEEFPLDSLYFALVNSKFSYKPQKKETDIDFLNRVLQQEDFYHQWITLFDDYELMEEVQNLVEETLLEQNSNSNNNSLQENIIKRNRKLMETTFWEFCPISEEPSIYKTLKKDNKGLTILKDGTFSYPENFRNRNQQQVLYAANKFSNKIFGLSEFTALSETKTKLLNEFLDYLQLRKYDVEILFLPYHPVVYDKIEHNYPMVKEAEILLKKISQQKGIKFYGSYNPESTNTNSSSFYDGMHLKAPAIEKILKLK
jgi:competence protein ComGF